MTDAINDVQKENKPAKKAPMMGPRRVEGAPVKREDKKVQAAAFLNWKVPTKRKDGEGNTIYLESNRGLSMFKEGRYTDPKEILLIKGAEKRMDEHGEPYLVLENCTITIRLNTSKPLDIEPEDLFG